MNRRDFLKYLLATPIAAEFDVEKLLWVKEKTIFVPSAKQIAFFNDTRPLSLISCRPMRIPLHFIPGMHFANVKILEPIRIIEK